MIVMRAAAPTTDTGRHSPFDARFDPFWARVDEAGITVVVHAGDSGQSSNGYAVDGFAANFRGGGFGPQHQELPHRGGDPRLPPVDDALRPLQEVPEPPDRVGGERGRVPRPTCSASSGPRTRRCPGWFGEDPVDQFRRHVWINPFWEDDLDTVVSLMGADRVIFGSDWPHIEGLVAPARLPPGDQGPLARGPPARAPRQRRRPRHAGASTQMR